MQGVLGRSGENDMAGDDEERLIRGLQRPAAYPHPVDEIQCFETHISWVLLTGPYAYKIKKPVDFGFLDYSTLARRKHFCEEELRLNARLAPSLYLQVVAINGSPDRPRIDGPGETLEYAVKMRQFDNTQRFDRLLAAGRLDAEHLRETAQVLARFHAEIAVAGADTPYGEAATVYQPMAENFTQLREFAAELFAQAAPNDILDTVQNWTQSSLATLQPSLAQRKQHGHIRECHGDLHTGNIILYQGRVTPFDGIEFNDRLRWIDTMSELAFLLMDLDDHARHDLAQHLLNAYLEISGDYHGLSVLRFYQCYRAMVRAKVAALRGAQEPTLRKETDAELVNYLRLAACYTRPGHPVLFITHGLSGSGKTWLSEHLLAASDAIRVRSDVERKRLAGLAPLARSKADVGGGLYAAEMSQRTYQRLAELARQIVQAGYPVIVDATFLRRAEREHFRRLAGQLGVPFRILHCETDLGVMRQRITRREQAGRDASEADLAVLDSQLAQQEPLGEDEILETIAIDTGKIADAATLVRDIERNLPSRLTPQVTACSDAQPTEA